MAGWYLWCNIHELGQTSGDGEGQGGLVCCSPWGREESDDLAAEQLEKSSPEMCLHLQVRWWVIMTPLRIERGMLSSKERK